jgi:hypothetical protein
MFQSGAGVVRLLSSEAAFDDIVEAKQADCFSVFIDDRKNSYL